MDRDEVNIKTNGFHAFRTGWPLYGNSIFRDKVEIVTNGILLTKEMSDRLINSGLDRLRISLQGLDEEKYIWNKKK